MKRLLLFWALFLCSITATFAQFSGSGSGTKDDPYKIFYAEQLTQVRNFLNQSGVYFKLMSDINLEDWIDENSPSEGWQPIGVEASKFKGIFDGNGHSIYSVNIDRSSTTNVGFFGCTDGATISNLNIEGEITGHQNVGGIVGNGSNTTLSNCTYKGTIKGDETIGGITGSFVGSINSCSVSNGVITGGKNAGGIAGYIDNASFSNCNVQATISGTENLGGIAGDAHNVSTLEKSTFKGNINGTNHIGGLFGSLNNCSSSISSCLAQGNYEGSDYVGGLIGYFYSSSNATISSNAYYGKLNGNSYVGGLIGQLIGHNSSSTFHNNYSISDLQGNGNYIAGLIGDAHLDSDDNSNNTINISDSYHSGNVNGSSYVGGLFGQLKGIYHYYYGSRETAWINLSNSLSIGSTYGSSNVGGIVGRADQYVSIKKCVAANEVISATSDNIGRIYGAIGNNNVTIGSLGTADGNLALSTTKVSKAGIVQTINDDDQNGMSISQTGLKLKANYVAHGWDFNNNWTIQETETYPYKPWQAAAPYIESKLVSQANVISGKSIDGGTVYLQIGDDYKDSTVCSNNKWTFSVPTLQSGEQVRLYAVSDSKWQSQYTDTYVGYPGSGTEADPYLVYTANDLQGVYRKGYYKLMNDVDLTDWINQNSPKEGWPAIGKNGISKIYFDGGNHTISGLWCSTTADYNGLFSNFPGGYIRNLNVKTAEGKKVSGGDYTGVLIGRFANGIIDNVTVDGDVASSARGGGIVGVTNTVKINNVKFTGSVISASDNAVLGGIVGESTADSIARCVTDVKITATGQSVTAGGIIGKSNSSLSLAEAQGELNLSGSDSYGGGLVGQNLEGGTVTNCFELADVTSTKYAAGLAAYNYGKISNSYSKGNINGTYNGAGCVGYNDGQNATINNLVAGNPKVNVTDEKGWSFRVLGGNKNSAPDPGENNYALNTMILSVNGVTKKATDNLLDGYAKTEAELESKATYQGLSWDFDKYWTIDEGKAWPQLNMVQTGFVTAVSVNPTKASVEVGKTITLNATVAPADALNKRVVWSSSDSKIAMVKDGVVTGVSAGTATITVSATDGSDKSASAEITVYTPANDSVVVKDTTVLKNSTITIPVYVGNKDPFCSFQFDIYLPEGMSIAKKSNGNYDIQWAGRQSDTHTMASRLQTDGAVRVVAFSASNDDFSGSDGAVVNIPVKVGNDIAAGNYAITIKNIVLADKQEQEFHCKDAIGTIKVIDYIMGDANDDQKVTLADVNATVNYIIGNPAKTFNFAAADMNRNNVINVSDVNAIVNILLGQHKDNSVATAKSYVGTRAATDTDDRIYCNDFSIAKGETKQLQVNLDNKGNYCSFQFDLILPQGISVETTPKANGGVKYSASLVTSRCTDHSIGSNLLDGNRFRVVVFSLTNTDVTGTTGPVVNINLKADDDMTEGEKTLRIENITLATQDEKEYYPTPSESKINVTAATGINGIQMSLDASKQKIYNLQGQRVNKVSRGVYIVDGKKVVVNK